MKPVLALAAVAALSFTAAAAHADVLFSNFGPGDSYNSGTGWTISTAASAAGGTYSGGEGFTAAADGDVSEIDVAIGQVSGSGGVDLDLWTDGFGALLGSWHLGSLPNFGDLGPPASVTGITGIHLTGGANYILFASALDTQWAAWNWNSIGGVGPHCSDGCSNNTQGAFRVISSVSDAPEPGVWALMLVGFGGLGAMLRRRRAEALAA